MKTEGRGLPLWLALLVAVASGFLIDAGFPDLGIWPLTIIGTILFLWTLVGRRAGSALLVGAVGGFAFYGTHIYWLTLYLGLVPWLALASLMTLWWALGAMLISIVLTVGPRVFPSATGRIGLIPLIVAGLWTLREGIASTWPWGGFAWGRLALSQSASPLGELVAWTGVSGLTFVMVYLAAIVVQLARARDLSWLLRAAIAATVVLVLVAVPAWQPTITGSTTVAAVQGNANAALNNPDPPGTVLENHASATLPLVGGTPVDMVIWPENASDIDPERSPEAAKVLDYISTAMEAPLLVGTITLRDGTYYNTSLLWKAGQGVVDWYDKKHPVPFAEWVPERSFFHAIVPDLIDLIPRGYGFGTRDSIFDVDGVKVGIGICFDVADDALIRDMVTGGAQMIAIQSNNADFGHTDQSAQQLAIARLRAIETGRSVVHISTVGTSAIVSPTGAIIDQLPTFTAGTMVDDVPLATGTTPAVTMGAWPDLLLGGFGLAGFIVIVVLGTMGRRRRA